MSCVDDDTLALFVQGLLPAERVAEVERHVDRCPDCTLLLVYFGRSFGDEEPLAASPYRATPDSDGEGLPEVGSKLGRYAIVHRVGSGGMGVVFTAFDPTLNRRVAIKLVKPDVSESSADRHRDRLLREARAMARLAHPNVLSVYDVGTFGDQVFIAMELVEGVTLSEWLALELRTVPQMVEVFRQAGRGLAAAHGAGIVHRDFKPGNVLVGVDGRVRVMDFGLARAEEEAPASRRALWAGLGERSESSTGGTLAYMAPEQITGGVTDARSDQYAFCVSLYEALYGQRPFRGEDPDTLLRSQRQMRPGFGRRVDVPDWVPSVLSRGLEPEPADRYESMGELLDALDGEAPRRAHAHVRATAVLLGGMWVVHLVWAGFVLPILINRAMEPGTGSSSDPSDPDLTAAMAALILLGWMPFGLIAAPINVVGLLLRRGWARIGTVVYALVSLPTVVGTPFALYALWTMTRVSVRRHVFGGGRGDVAVDARVHVRTNALIQLGMWVVHAALMVFVIPLIVHLAEPLGGRPTPAAEPYGTGEEVFLAFAALITLLWIPLGTVWTAVNAYGLWRGRWWARWTTAGYALLSVLTGLGTPAAVYALWSLSRSGVGEVLRRVGDRGRASSVAQPT